jgi:hypothetical protein
LIELLGWRLPALTFGAAREQSRDESSFLIRGKSALGAQSEIAAAPNKRGNMVNR